LKKTASKQKRREGCRDGVEKSRVGKKLTALIDPVRLLETKEERVRQRHRYRELSPGGERQKRRKGGGSADRLRVLGENWRENNSRKFPSGKNTRGKIVQAFAGRSWRKGKKSRRAMGV